MSLSGDASLAAEWNFCSLFRWFFCFCSFLLTSVFPVSWKIY